MRNGTDLDALNVTRLYQFAPMYNDSDSFQGLEDQIKEVGDTIDKLIVNEKAELDKFKKIMVEIKAQLDSRGGIGGGLSKNFSRGGGVNIASFF